MYRRTEAAAAAAAAPTAVALLLLLSAAACVRCAAATPSAKFSAGGQTCAQKCSAMRLLSLNVVEFAPQGPRASDVTVVSCISTRPELVFSIQIDSILRQGAAIQMYIYSGIKRSDPGERRPEVVLPKWCSVPSLCLASCNARAGQKLVFLDMDTFANLSSISQQLDAIPTSEVDEASSPSVPAVWMNSVVREHWNWHGVEEPNATKIQANVIALRASNAAFETLDWWMKQPLAHKYNDQGPIHDAEKPGVCGVEGKIGCLKNSFENRFHCLGQGKPARNKRECMDRVRGPAFYSEMFPRVKVTDAMLVDIELRHKVKILTAMNATAAAAAAAQPSKSSTFNSASKAGMFRAREHAAGASVLLHNSSPNFKASKFRERQKPVPKVDANRSGDIANNNTNRVRS